MQVPGQRLRQSRERLRLRYRDVEKASEQIADLRGNSEFVVGLSRLADIENKGTTPSIYRLYSLCAIYGLGFSTVLSWYDIPLERLLEDAARLKLAHTRIFEAESSSIFDERQAIAQSTSDAEIVTGQINSEPVTPESAGVSLLQAGSKKSQRYALIGNEDWSMYPLILPGSFVQIDGSKNRLAKGGWLHEYERPIYMIEHRSGLRCGWCNEHDGHLTIQFHPSSQCTPETFRFPSEADIVGQVVAVSMRLDQVRRRHTHF